MRNIKRVLCFILTVSILSGMMTFGVSAKYPNDFSDTDQIINRESADVTTSLGLFNCDSEGSFHPQGIITRAEFAVILAKLLCGPDVDPSRCMDEHHFTDIPAWAEGYVNLCVHMGIIKNTGNDKFIPDQEVTAAEATAMLMKALGYFMTPACALGKDWVLESTSKAAEIGLYKQLPALSVDEALTRDYASALVFNALFLQRVQFDDYRGQYVKNNDRFVVVSSGTFDDTNTLAYGVWGLLTTQGIVIANGNTDEFLSETPRSGALTSILFSQDTDLDRDGMIDYSEGESYDFEVETGLDMIGHSAKLYYTLEYNEPVVSSITDQAVLVQYIDYNVDDTHLAKDAYMAGFKPNTILDIPSDHYVVNYDMNTLYQDLFGPDQFDLDTLLVISNSSDKSVDYVIALDQYLDAIESVEINRFGTEYRLAGFNGSDMNIVCGSPSRGDLVIVTDIGKQNSILYAEPARVKEAKITKIVSTENHPDSGIAVTKIVAGGKEYPKSNVQSNVMDHFIEFSDIRAVGTYSLILDQLGSLIGLSVDSSAPGLKEYQLTDEQGKTYLSLQSIPHNAPKLRVLCAICTGRNRFVQCIEGRWNMDMTAWEFPLLPDLHQRNTKFIFCDQNNAPARDAIIFQP